MQIRSCFSLIRTSYSKEYEDYIQDGLKDDLISRLNSDATSSSTDAEIIKRKAVLNKQFEETPFTVLQVILSTLQ